MEQFNVFSLKGFKRIFQGLWILFFLFGNLMPQTWAGHSSDEALREQGVIYRKQKDFNEAITCFIPLAEKNDARAQHNVAFCYYELGDQQAAYNWYKKASEQGFQPSLRNLNRMNLMDLLLPNEVMLCMVDSLSLADFSRFSRVSKRTHAVFESRISQTNFLTSNAVYAADFRSFFKEVIFDPPPQAIRLKYLMEADSGSIEVHFRDSNHLRAIVEKTPLIQPDSFEDVYFVRDTKVEDGKEFIATEDSFHRRFFVHVQADNPVNLSGKLTLTLNLELHCPSDSSFKDLESSGNFRLTMRTDDDLVSHKVGHDLAAAIETFDEPLLQQITAEGIRQLEDQKQRRHLHPALFPSLLELCPNVCFVHDPDDIFEIHPVDMLRSSGKIEDFPIIYVGGSIDHITSLKQDLPAIFSISYIDLSRTTPGIYCLGALTIQKRFKVSASGNLAITGEMHLPDYYVDITAEKNLWKIDLNYSPEHHFMMLAGDYSGSPSEAYWHAILRFREREPLIP
jgi:tetratricopeptide (TPR) repeat protein